MGNKKNIVDIKTNTKVDIYTVAKSFSDKKSTLFKTNVLKEAIYAVDQAEDTYYVYNSKGKIVYSKKKEITNVKVSINQKIKADGINVYSISTNTIPDSCYHGTLTIIDDRLYSNKYKVITDEEFPITYFCNCDDIKRYIRELVK